MEFVRFISKCELNHVLIVLHVNVADVPRTQRKSFKNYQNERERERGREIKRAREVGVSDRERERQTERQRD